MRYTSTDGKTYELNCFEFYNKRFFCLGNLVGDNEICEFVSSYNFKYLLINDGYGKSTFKSNKLTANPALILKDPNYNEKFKNENNDLYYEKDIDIEDYGPTAYNGRYTCIGELKNLNIPEESVFETFKIPAPKTDHWLIDHDEEYARLHKGCGKTSVPRLYCAMPFVKVYNEVKIIHFMTQEGKHYFDTNSLGAIINADIGRPNGQNGFYRLNAFYKLGPSKGFNFCDKNFIASTKIDKLIDISNYGSSWVSKYAVELPMKERRRRNYALRFFYEYVKKFKLAISESRSNEIYRATFKTLESGKKVRVPKAYRDFMYKIVFFGETMNEFRIFRFEQVDRAELNSDPGYAGADLTNRIVYWPTEGSWYVDGKIDFTNDNEFIKFNDFSKKEFLKIMFDKYGITGKTDMYELFRNWIPEKFIRNLHFFNIKMNKSANTLFNKDKTNISLNIGFVRAYHFDDEYVFGTYMSLSSILSTFGLHHTIAKNMLTKNRFDVEALDVIPGLKDCIFNKMKVNEFGMMTPDSYVMPCRDDEYPKQLNTIMLSIPEALQFINNGLYKNSENMNAHWRRNANELLTAFPEITISKKIKGHNINDLYPNVPKLSV